MELRGTFHQDQCWACNTANEAWHPAFQTLHPYPTPSTLVSIDASRGTSQNWTLFHSLPYLCALHGSPLLCSAIPPHPPGRGRGPPSPGSPSPPVLVGAPPQGTISCACLHQSTYDLAAHLPPGSPGSISAGWVLLVCTCRQHRVGRWVKVRWMHQ